jgi:hypothetical protein
VEAHSRCVSPQGRSGQPGNRALLLATSRATAFRHIEEATLCCFRIGCRRALRLKFGTEIAEILSVLEQISDELPRSTWNVAFDKCIARIESARAAPETWLGRPPASNVEAEWEVTPAFGHLQFAISFCNAAQVPDDVMEAMFLRFCLRTRVLNDHLPEVFFQNLDERWDQVHAQVQGFLARYSGPPVQ